jgi:Transglutaminase-like superfamily
MSTQMALDPAAPARGQRLVGTIGLVIALALLRLPHRHVEALVARLARRAQPATADQAAAALAAVRRASWLHPARTACLEESLAAVVAVRLRGRRVDWCIGARTLPFAAHAWIEAEGMRIGQQHDRPYILLKRI